MASSTSWPDLAYEDWKETLATLHLWTQVVGKVRLERTPWISHSWHVPLYPDARGLGTSAIPGERGGVFDIEFDFVDHVLRLRSSDGGAEEVELRPRSVADFHAAVMDRLGALGVPTDIDPRPSEIPDAIPFDEDETHAAYDPEAAARFWTATVRAWRVFQAFRARFRGKSSPVHFFWGSFDLAVSRFSGRPAPPHPAGIPALPDWVAREAYDREVSSLGFWPGGDMLPEPIFYSYVYPTPDGFPDASVPEAARWNGDLGEFVLPYEAVRSAPDPEGLLLEFAQATYEAAADLGDWERAALEWPGGADGPPER